jgi:hypothetical protein
MTKTPFPSKLRLLGGLCMLELETKNIVKHIVYLKEQYATFKPI